MEKTTLTTYLIMQGSMRIHAYDTEIHFTDYGAKETVSIEGLDPRELHRAVLLYIHNLSLLKDNDVSNRKWFEDLKDAADEAIARINSRDGISSISD